MTSQPPSSRLRKPTMRGGKPRPNSSTRIPAHFAVIKWPNSCTSTSRPNTGIAASQNQFIISFLIVKSVVHRVLVLFDAPRHKPPKCRLYLAGRQIDVAQAQLLSVLQYLTVQFYHLKKELRLLRLLLPIHTDKCLLAWPPPVRGGSKGSGPYQEP